MGDKRQKGEIEMGNKEPVRFKERKFVILIERESTVLYGEIRPEENGAVEWESETGMTV